MISTKIRGEDWENQEVDAPEQSVKNGSMVESIYHTLLQGILNGHYAHQAVLSELALARELGVSRTPVHDALRQLAKDGLVTREQNCRARVAGITRDDVFEVFELRKFLEGPAAELAAGRMDRRHLAPLRASADALLADPNAKDWTLRWADFDETFHSTIGEASGNRRLAQDISRYRLLHKGFNHLATDPDCLQSAMAEHLGILEALERKDGQLARERMVAHIAAWQDFFMRSVPNAGGTIEMRAFGAKPTRQRQK
jgi:DNA-binding GntR family transcriptional regulator